MENVRTSARQEREAFADLLDGLTPQQWTMPTLCDGWSVRDVAAHTIAYLGQSVPRLALRMLACRGDVDRLNANGLAACHGATADQLRALMRAGVEPSGAGALYGSRVALIECLVHQQDIRRPLGIPRVIGEDGLRVALSYARTNPVVGGARRTRGLRLVATDLDWSAGKGPEVRGSGEALLLAMTGRIKHLRDELSGAGVTQLR